MKKNFHLAGGVLVVFLVGAVGVRAQEAVAPADASHADLKLISTDGHGRTRTNTDSEDLNRAGLAPLPAPIQYRAVAPGVMLRQASPVLYFRGILGMSPSERDRALADKPAESRKVLLAKVEEYTKLPPDIREARLRQTQLRWELISLTNLPAAGREAFIQEAAPEDRALLEDYDQWLGLSPEGRTEMVSQLSPDRHQALTRALAQWESVSESERQERSTKFGEFFDLDQTQQQKRLTAFTEADRQTMERVLRIFAGLSEAQRKTCIQSFQKFATMDAADLDEFLKNAARWEAMTAEERGLWARLVQRYPIMPPSPPGMHFVQYPPVPPMPPGMILYPPMPPGMSPPAPYGVPAGAAANSNTLR